MSPTKEITCLCDWHSYMVGDGCEQCNPDYTDEENINEREACTSERDS